MVLLVRFVLALLLLFVFCTFETPNLIRMSSKFEAGDTSGSDAEDGSSETIIYYSEEKLSEEGNPKRETITKSPGNPLLEKPAYEKKGADDIQKNVSPSGDSSGSDVENRSAIKDYYPEGILSEEEGPSPKRARIAKSPMNPEEHPEDDIQKNVSPDVMGKSLANRSLAQCSTQIFPVSPSVVALKRWMSSGSPGGSVMKSLYSKDEFVDGNFCNTSVDAYKYDGKAEMKFMQYGVIPAPDVPPITNVEKAPRRKPESILMPPKSPETARKSFPFRSNFL